MEEKQVELVKKFNQLRLELGDVEYQIMLMNDRKATLGTMLRNTQALYEEAVKQTPPAPNVGQEASPDASNIVQDAPGDVAEADPSPDYHPEGSGTL